MAKTQLLTLLISIIFSLVEITTSNEANVSTGSFNADVLLKFKSTISDPMGYLRNWNENSNPCTSPVWSGVICYEDEEVYGLKLESMNLSGQLNLDPLSALSIRFLSFANNNFTGPMPDLKRFKAVRSLYFLGNGLSGEIDDDAFDGMETLKKVALSGNGFSGPIPSSLTRVNWLVELWMDHNEFVGTIPDFKQLGLKVLNVSYNNLEGEIPDILRKMNVTMFEGNSGLCGPPTKVTCESLAPSPSPEARSYAN